MVAEQAASVGYAGTDEQGTGWCIGWLHLYCDVFKLVVRVIIIGCAYFFRIGNRRCCSVGINGNGDITNGIVNLNGRKLGDRYLLRRALLRIGPRIADNRKDAIDRGSAYGHEDDDSR